MSNLFDFVKDYKIPLGFLTQEMGYTVQHISAVLNGRKKATKKFLKLLDVSIQKYIEKEYKNLAELRRDA